MRRTAAAAALVALLASGVPGQADPASPWYLERGPAPSDPGAVDPVLRTALDLAELLRDGGVPGFYDGQFASTRDRFDELAAIASDPDVNHVLRVMAVMALQVADSGERVAAVLEPLLLDPYREWLIEYNAYNNPFSANDEETIRDELAAELSQHARFALAKDGQPGPVLEKIAVMQEYVDSRMDVLLDPSIESQGQVLGVAYGRNLIFEIGYHHQQFDDYDHAVEWFRKLTDHLPGHRETRWAHYNLACIAALQGRPEEAVTELEAAHAVGFTDVAWMEEDGDLASIRDRPDYAALVARIRNEPPPDPPDVEENSAP